MSISFISFDNFSINISQSKNADYTEVEPESNLYHSLYFTVRVQEDISENTYSDVQSPVNMAFQCLLKNSNSGSNCGFDNDFIINVHQDEDSEDYLVCLETSFLKYANKYDPKKSSPETKPHELIENMTGAFENFERSFYSIMSSYQNDGNYDNDDDVFYSSKEQNNSYLVNGQYIEKSDFQEYFDEIRDVFFTDPSNTENRISIDELAKKEIDDLILDACVMWIKNENLKPFVILDNKTEIVKKITSCNKSFRVDNPLSPN